MKRNKQLLKNTIGDWRVNVHSAFSFFKQRNRKLKCEINRFNPQ